MPHGWKMPKLPTYLINRHILIMCYNLSKSHKLTNNQYVILFILYIIYNLWLTDSLDGKIHTSVVYVLRISYWFYIIYNNITDISTMLISMGICIWWCFFHCAYTVSLWVYICEFCSVFVVNYLEINTSVFLIIF